MSVARTDPVLRALALVCLALGVCYLALRFSDLWHSYTFMIGRVHRPFFPPGSTILGAAIGLSVHLVRQAAPFAVFAIEIAVVAEWALWVAAHRARRVDPPPPARAGQAPFITVLVPVTDEPDDVVAHTLRSAQQMRYPSDRCRILLLDERGSAARRAMVDALNAARAGSASGHSIEVCSRAGTADAGRAFKAGNLNFGVAHAPPLTEGFVLLDADHAPRAALLEVLVPYLAHPRFGFVQTPQTYRTTDGAPLTVDAWDRPCREFHTVTQPHRAHLDAVMLTGTGALVSAEALRAVGGFDTASVTEDIVTGANMQARGFASFFCDTPVADGLVPVALHDVLRQRLRWAQGSFQLLRRPALWRALGARRAIAYASGVAHFLFPIFTFLIAALPALVLLAALDPAVHYGTASVAVLLAFAAVRHAARERFCTKLPLERAAAAVLAVALGPVYLWGLVTGLRRRPIAFRVTPKHGASPVRVTDVALVGAPVALAALSLIAVGRLFVQVHATGYPIDEAALDYGGLVLLSLFVSACGLAVLWLPRRGG